MTSWIFELSFKTFLTCQQQRLTLNNLTGFLVLILSFKEYEILKIYILY